LNATIISFSISFFIGRLYVTIEHSSLTVVCGSPWFCSRLKNIQTIRSGNISQRWRKISIWQPLRRFCLCIT